MCNKGVPAGSPLSKELCSYLFGEDERLGAEECEGADMRGAEDGADGAARGAGALIRSPPREPPSLFTRGPAGRMGADRGALGVVVLAGAAPVVGADLVGPSRETAAPGTAGLTTVTRLGPNVSIAALPRSRTSRLT